LEKSEKYSTKSLYKLMTFGGVRDVQMMRIWNCNIPLKVKKFLWMAAQDRIQSSVQLKKKQWSGPEKYAVCDQLESTYHILFQCPVAVYLWSFLRDSFGWLKSPTSCVEFFSEVLEAVRGKKTKSNFVHLCSCHVDDLEYPK